MPLAELQHPTTLADRFERLDRLLEAHAWLWRPQPFKEARPAWTLVLPALTEQLLGLGEAELGHLSQDTGALMALITAHVPSMAPVAAITTLPEHPARSVPEPGPHLEWGIPGRKWRQIRAFAGALGPIRAPLVEWCGGKGHLGRVLGAQWGTAVVTVDHDPALCAEGMQLAERVGVRQHFTVADALAPATADCLGRHHAVALHACGELHRTLLRRGAGAGVAALDVVPCCYHHAVEERYVPLSRRASLRLERDDLRLAVTETVTALPREVRRRDREMAWKLGFDRLRRQASGEDRYVPANPIHKQWLTLDFEGFCRAFAAREGVALPAGVAWAALEAHGWERQRETMRLNLVRAAFRRAIEVWLVLDLATYLEEQGYGISIGTFCPREVTPRNILISARHPG